MEQQQARELIKSLIMTGVPVHPDSARQLYTDAGYDIPLHLKKKEFNAKETEMIKKAFEEAFKE